MEFTKSKLKGAFFISLNPIQDNRGFFMRTYEDKLFKKQGLHREWRQENHSKSIQKGILRGLHFQLPPFSETKLVRCINGKILDVFVDLRKDSPTFGHYDSVILSAENNKQVYIPRGFAHGFLTLSEVSEVVYKVDNIYNKDYEFGLIWNDPNININWPIRVPVLSQKDQNNLSLACFVDQYGSIGNLD